MGKVRDFIFLGSKITADGDSIHEIKRHLLLGRKAMTILDSILKSRDRRNKMAEEWADVEYVCLHGYIRNTPSDTEVHAEHQLRADRST